MYHVPFAVTIWAWSNITAAQYSNPFESMRWSIMSDAYTPYRLLTLRHHSPSILLVVPQQLSFLFSLSIYTCISLNHNNFDIAFCLHFKNGKDHFTKYKLLAVFFFFLFIFIIPTYFILYQSIFYIILKGFSLYYLWIQNTKLIAKCIDNIQKFWDIVYTTLSFSPSIQNFYDYRYETFNFNLQKYI